MEEQSLTIKYDPTSKQTNYKGVQNAEYLMRMQYLLQASEIVKDAKLQRYYASEMKNIAKRQVLRIDSDIKQRFCKRCNNRIDQQTDYYKSQPPKQKNKMTKVQCEYCLYANKVKGCKYINIEEKQDKTQKERNQLEQKS